MTDQITSPVGFDESPFVWTQQDDAEYNRLANEMNEDAKLQFTLFTFGITASIAVLSFLANTVLTANAAVVIGLPSGYFFVLPLGILIPTSLVILNRARTRNRKAAYIVVCFDYKRLCAYGITNSTHLNDVRRQPFIPWETALHILDRTNQRVDRRVHLAPALKYMAICYAAIEILCIVLSLYLSIRANLVFGLGLGLAIAFICIPAYRTRVKALRALKEDKSIQGYVEQWLLWKFSTYDEIPRYLRDLIREYKGDHKRPVGFP